MISAARHPRVVGRPLGSRRSRVPSFTAARVTAMLSHSRIAAALHVSAKAVYAWERGSARPSEDHIDGLAELFRCERTVIERWFGVEFVRAQALCERPLRGKAFTTPQGKGTP